MDSETVKRLILEKLFNEFIPKLIGYYRLLSPEKDQWNPNFFLLKENIRLNTDGYEIYFYVAINKDGFFERCTVSKIRVRASLGHIMLEHLQRVEPETLDFNFDNKNTAINELCRILNNSYVLKLGMCALQEIENHEVPENCSVGAIKKILGLSPNMDLNNIETRKVLLEKIK